jgi:hypothetical protein
MRGIGPLWIGIGPVWAAARPGVTSAMNCPLLPYECAALVADDRQRRIPSRGCGGIRNVHAIVWLPMCGDELGCVREMHNAIGIAMEDDGRNPIAGCRGAAGAQLGSQAWQCVISAHGRKGGRDIGGRAVRSHPSPRPWRRQPIGRPRIRRPDRGRTHRRSPR